MDCAAVARSLHERTLAMSATVILCWPSLTLQLDNLLLHGAWPQPTLQICDFGYSKDEDDSVSKSACGTPGTVMH